MLAKLLAARRGTLRCGQLAAGFRRLSATPDRTSSPSETSSYSSREYPLAKEAPEITRSNAAETRTRTTSSSSHSFRPTDPSYDPFDDYGQLTPEQATHARHAQKSALSTQLRGSSPIAPTVPAHIPSNVPAAELAVPTTELTTLPNGVRVVSQEMYGPVSTIGVVSSVGSRLERPAETGVTNLLEVLAFGSTSKRSGLQITENLMDWSGTRFVNTSREQSLHCIDILRTNTDPALELLAEALLEPQFTPDEVLEAQQALEYQAMALPPELVLGEALQEAAYGQNQQLGQSHYAPAEALAHLGRDHVVDFWQRQFVHNPHGLVVSGVGVRHDYLLEHAERLFGHLQQSDEQHREVPSTYLGGDARRHLPSLLTDEKELVRLAIALPVGGWHHDDLVPACVLQTLLGGGNSFSAGGPGKGMYSRLYRQVLNRYYWAESAEALTSFANEGGLVGISGSAPPRQARDMLQVLAEHLTRLAVEPVTDEELDRAIAMLKCNVLMQLESRLVLFEDLGRQVLTYGHREDLHATCARIEAVTQDDIMALGQRMNTHVPALAAVGEDLSHLPPHDEVAGWFR